MEQIIDNQYFTASKDDQLAIVRFKSEVFELITDVDVSQNLTDFIKETEHDKKIKGLMLSNEPRCLGEKVYDEFMQSILHESSLKADDIEVATFTEKNIRFREINILNKFVKFLANYRKLYFSAINCEIVTPFMGVILVADIRFATAKARFIFKHKKYGLHPAGGLPFFLDHYVGHSKAVELMLSDELKADDAFRLGLINKMMAPENFEQNTIDIAKEYLRIPMSTIKTTKRLINFNNSVLEDYFDYEYSLLNL
jgi:enoyl-CoA hydratase/carnithine racemase